MSKVYEYFRCCVDWPQGKVHCEGGLCDMIDQELDITRETFLKHVDRANLAEIEEQLGYMKHPSQGLTMAGDWHVSYHRSRYEGQRVYFFRHSRIEYVFI